MRAILTTTVLAAVLLTACGAREPYDVIIRNGMVVDGTGSPPRQTDVGIRGDRIVRIGNLSSATAARIIEAGGLHVAPGYIDVHSHAGEALGGRGLSTAHALLAQGITTVVINPDGGGAIDLADQRARLLEHGLGVNVMQLVPHGSIRGRVMGSSDRNPTTEEQARMNDLVRAGMEEGAFGLSSGLFYTPGIYSKTEEVIEMARVAAAYGGVYSSHIRDEADYNIGVVAAVDEVIRIAREGGLPGVVSHIKALGPNVWGLSGQIVANIEAARAAGVEVWADQYPYDASATGFVAAVVPAWAREGGLLQQRMADPELGARILAEIQENLDRRGGGARIMFRGSGPLAGRTLADFAGERGLSERDAAVELVRRGNAPGIISFNMNDDDIALFMRQSWMMTSTDGGLSVMGDGVPHPRNYGAFARKIRQYVMVREVVDLPTAIRSMSGLAAEVFRVEDRGVIREGMIADVVVFDLGRVNDPASFDNPHQLSEGMVYVLVNGVLAVDDGAFTDALAGQVLHRKGVTHAFRRGSVAPPTGDAPADEAPIGG
jgi:N-acyl-D-amino-acid deacylase